jgi:glycosyltransferase involved in cell wall biosynthesis
VVEPRRGGLTEIVEKTGGGILVDPGDTAALAQAIYSLWKDPALLEQLGKRGVEGVRQHYSAARMAARALEVWRTL